MPAQFFEVPFFIGLLTSPFLLLLKRCFMKRLCFWLAAVLLMTVSAVTAQQNIPRGVHGDAIGAYQTAYLDSLQKGLDPENAIPSGVDTDYWNSLIPEGNTPTKAKYELGKKLYFDTRLSVDGTESCATCHDATRGFGDGLSVSEGVNKVVNGQPSKQFGTRNAPTTMNVGLLHTMFWDGRSPSIEHQAMQPIVNPVEMGMPLAEETIIAGIKDDEEYKRLFQEAYEHDVNYPDIGNAIAVFERTLVFMNNPFFRNAANLSERVRTSKEPVSPSEFPDLSPMAWEGWKIFNREGRCNSCHQISPSNPLGTDNKFHNIGVAAHNRDFEKLASAALTELAKDNSDEALDKLALTTDMGELGRFVVTKNENEIGAFRTPMLLNVGITGPYMHDGSFATLWDVIDHYNKGGIPNRWLDGGIEPLNLTEHQIDALVEFLFSLTDSRFAQQNRFEYERQKAQALNRRPERNDNLAARRTLTFETPKMNGNGGEQ